MTYIRTVKEISGRCIPTIPVGTQGVLGAKYKEYSIVKGFPVSSMYNDEFEIVWDDRASGVE